MFSKMLCSTLIITLIVLLHLEGSKKLHSLLILTIIFSRISMKQINEGFTILSKLEEAIKQLAEISQVVPPRVIIK